MPRVETDNCVVSGCRHDYKCVRVHCREALNISSRLCIIHPKSSSLVDFMECKLFTMITLVNPCD